jgi:transcriptional regulator with XRE-family HTH domain
VTSNFGSELRRRRQRSELSIADMASQIHYSKSYLSKIERGEKSPNPTLVRLCDAALGANGALVEFAALAQDPDPHVPEPFDDVDEHADPSPGHWAQPARAFSVEVLPPDIEALSGLFQTRLEQARAIGRIANPFFVLPSLISDTHMVTGIARHTPVPADAHRLFGLAARFADLISWMVQEAGDDREAQWWIDRAAKLAGAGESADLEHYMLVRHADLALAGDDPLAALARLEPVQQDLSLSAWVRGLAAQRAAEALALLGQAEGCMRALDTARTLLDEQPEGGAMVGATHAPDPIALTTGWAMVDLGRVDGAAALLAEQLEHMPAGSLRPVTRFRVRQALALAIGGDTSAATDLITRVLEDIRRIDSATIRRDLRRLNAELRRRVSHAPAQDLLPVLADLLRRPVSPS